MSAYYKVFFNDDEIYECSTRDEAHEFINKKHSQLMPFLEYEPLGDGSVEIWTNSIITINVYRIREGRVNIESLLKNHIRNEKEEVKRAPKEVNVSKVTPCTPRRTRMYDKNKKLEKATEGKKKTDDKGQVWISKRNKKGEYKWTRFYENSYEGNLKRKAPALPAKDFADGKEKKGLDGKMWKVMTMKNGVKKWTRK